MSFTTTRGGPMPTPDPDRFLTKPVRTVIERRNALEARLTDAAQAAALADAALVKADEADTDALRTAVMAGRPSPAPAAAAARAAFAQAEADHEALQDAMRPARQALAGDLVPLLQTELDAQRKQLAKERENALAAVDAFERALAAVNARAEVVNWAARWLGGDVPRARRIAALGEEKANGDRTTIGTALELLRAELRGEHPTRPRMPDPGIRGPYSPAPHSPAPPIPAGAA